jgi:hypothetical protein
VIIDTLNVLVFSRPIESSYPLPYEEKCLLREIVLNLCLHSTDILFHYQLYTWYIEHELHDELFKIKSTFLIQFLTSDEV